MTEGRIFLWGVIAGALVRLPFLRGVGRGVNADEAWTGLMSVSILRGEFPVFMPGLGYMGSIEAYATAVLFWLFGPATTLLYAVPTVLSILVIPLVAILARRLWGEAAMPWAALFAAIQPAFLVVFGNAPRLGYVETLLWGILLLLLTERLVHAEGARRERGVLLVLGLVTGLGVWTNLLIAPFAATGIAILVWRRFGLITSLRVGWAFYGFALGSFPFWVFNVHNGFWSFALLESDPGGEMGERVRMLAVETLPVALGLREIWGGKWFAPGLVFAGAGYVLLAVAAAALSFGRGRREQTPIFSFSFPAILLGFVLLAFVASRYGTLGSPRYLFPIYVGLPLILAAALSAARRRARWAPLLAVPILLGNAAGIARAYDDFTRPGSGESEVPTLAPAVEFLRLKGIDRVYADYGISVRFNWETLERTIAAEPLDERFPPYALHVYEASRVAIADIGRFRIYGQEALPRNLTAVGLEFEETHVGGWRIFHGFRSVDPESVRIAPNAWRAESSEPRDDSEKAFDRDVTTRWGSGKPRQDGIWYLLDLGKIETVHRVVLLPGMFVTDHPVGLRIEASADKKTWRRVWEVRDIMPGLHVCAGQPRFDASGGAEAYFSAVQARYLRFTHLGNRPPFDWSIGEIFVFSPGDGDGGRGTFQSLVKARRDLSLGRTARGMEKLSCILALDPEDVEAHRLKGMMAAGVRP